MKYIKTYKIFEHHLPLDSEMVDYLKDIFFDLEDIGLNPEVIRYKTEHVDRLTIGIYDDYNKLSFNLDYSILSCLQHINDYMDNMDYKLSYIIFNCEDEDGIKQKDEINDSLDELKRITNVFGYKNFKNMILTFKKKTDK